MFKITLVLAVLALALLAVVLLRSSVKERERRWDEAMRNPTWEVFESIDDGGITSVNLGLIARDGRENHVFRSTLVGSADIAAPDWEIELQILRETAERKCTVLNEARNKRGGES